MPCAVPIGSLTGCESARTILGVEWLIAIQAYEAGLVCDPMNQNLRMRLEDAQDRLKKSETEQE